MNPLLYRLLLAMFALFIVSAAVAEEESEHIIPGVNPAVIIAYSGDVFLSHAELDAAFSRIPEEERLVFIRNGARVDQLIQALLLQKTLAADARKAGYHKEALMEERLKLAAEKELAEAWSDALVRTAPEADFAQLGYEDYLANPDNYRTQETLDISHILISTESRTPEDAKLLADSIYDRLQKEPERFEEMVAEFSDDPSKADNQGRFAEVQAGQLVASFEQAAFGLTQPGELSKPVLTPYGFHVIRLNSRSGTEPAEYENVKEEATANARGKYLERYREQYIRNLLVSPIVLPEGAVEIMARRHFGENLEKAPNFEE